MCIASDISDASAHLPPICIIPRGTQSHTGGIIPSTGFPSTTVFRYENPHRCGNPATTTPSLTVIAHTNWIVANNPNMDLKGEPEHEKRE